MNVIAPIMTDPKGAAWRQTIYHPYYLASRFGRGVALDLQVASPTYDAEAGDRIPYVDIAGIHDEAGGTATFFAVNRHGTETIQLEIGLHGLPGRQGDRPSGDDLCAARCGQHCRRSRCRGTEKGRWGGDRWGQTDPEARAVFLSDDPRRRLRTLPILLCTGSLQA